jgi:hypothetical protein
MIEIKERLFSDEVKKLAPVLGRETAERLSKAYLIGDETTRKRIIEMLDMVKAAVLSDSEMRDAPLLEPPPQENGIIKVGELIYGGKEAGPLCLDVNSFMTHIGIFGSSGYGKTNLSHLIIKQLSDNNVPVVVFDFSKKNYRDLLQTELHDRINIYTLGGTAAPFKFNPLKAPPGISKNQWAKEFAEVFDHAYWLLGGGQHIVLKALNRLYGESDNPTLADLKKSIEEYKGNTARENNWISTSLRPMESLCVAETGDMFLTADGIRPSSFFTPGTITIFEMDALSTNDKTFFIEIILQWIRDWLVTSNNREILQGVIILEEAHHILNREKSRKIGSETVMDLVFREMRELGLGIVYLDQHPSMVSYPALGNTSTHFYMNLGLDTRYSSDIQDAKNMLGLEDEEGSYLRTLPPGNSFVLMRRAQWRKPFTARIDLFPIKKGLIRDDDVTSLMKNKINFEPEQRDITKGLDDVQLRIINAIGAGRGVFTSQLYTQLKLSGSTFKDYMKVLVRNGLVGIREVRVEKTKANYYYLTDSGERVLAEKYPAIAEKEKEYHIVEEAKRAFEAMGWKYEEHGNEFVINNDDKTMNLIVLSKHDRKSIEKSVKGGTLYVCATAEIRNILLQYAAKKANNMERMTLSVALIEGFPQKGFEDYVF